MKNLMMTALAACLAVTALTGSAAASPSFSATASPGLSSGGDVAIADTALPGVDADGAEPSFGTPGAQPMMGSGSIACKLVTYFVCRTEDGHEHCHEAQEWVCSGT